LRIQVGEYPLDNVGVLDAGDDPHRSSAAGRTGLYVLLVLVFERVRL
jgi:hypothetical protein